MQSEKTRWLLPAVAAAVLAGGDWTASAQQIRSSSASSVAVAMDNASVSIAVGQKPLLKYRHADVPFKPYVAELYSPGGVQILRDSPHDHQHHHALMFAVGVDGVDFWSETPVNGTQKTRSLAGVQSSVRNGDARAWFTHELDWVEPAGKTLAVERRTIEVTPLGGPTPVTLLTWRTRLSPPAGKESIELGGSHYFGLGVRFVESMDLGGRFFNAANEEGEVVRGSERLTAAKWFAYAATADGKPVTVAVFDDPSNARHPARMFTMSPPFAYIAATLNLWKEPLRVEAGKPLELRYGVALWDGTVEPAQVEAVYQNWVQGGTGAK